MHQYLHPRVYFILIGCLFQWSAFAQNSFIQVLAGYFTPMPEIENFQHIKFEWNIPGNVQVIMNEGLTNLDNENQVLAINNFTQVITKTPDFWPAYYYRAISYRLTGQFKDALSDLEQCNKLHPNNAEVIFSIGETNHILGNLNAADDKFNIAIKLKPNFAEAYYGLGNIYFIKGNVRLANKNYDRCAELNPKFTLGYLMQGFIKIGTGKTSDAVAIIEKGLSIDSLESKFLLLRAFIYLDQNKLDVALKDLTKFVTVNPQNHFFLILRGYIHLELQDFDRSYNDFRKAILTTETDKNKYLTGESQLDRRMDIEAAAQYAVRFSYGLKEEALIHFKKGFCYFLTDRYKLAIEHFSNASKVESSATIYYLKAVTFEHSDHHDSAFVYYDKALKLDNEIFDAHKKRGIYRHELKDWKGAYADFNEMIKQQPLVYGTYRLRGLIKYNLKDYYGALLDFTQYLKADSTNAEIFTSRASCRNKIKDFKGSNDDYRTTMKLDSTKRYLYLKIAENFLCMNDTTWALSVLDTMSVNFPNDMDIRLKRIAIFIAQRRWDNALELIVKPLKSLAKSQDIGHNRDLASLYHYRAEIFYRQGKYKDALKDFDNAIRTKTFDDSRYLRAKCYLALGQPDKAKTDLTPLAHAKFKDAETLLAQLR